MTSRRFTPLAQVVAVLAGVAAALFVLSVVVSRDSSWRLPAFAAASLVSVVVLVFQSASASTLRRSLQGQLPGVLDSNGMRKRAFSWVLESTRLLRVSADTRVSGDRQLDEDVARFRSLTMLAFGLFAVWLGATFVLLVAKR